MRLLACAVALGLSSVAFADASAPARSTLPIHSGKVGQAPVEVVFDYLKERIADERGLGEYRTLSIEQQGKGGEVPDQVSLRVEMKGLLDDAVAAQRYRLTMHFDEVWQIEHVQHSWQCRRGKPGWTQRPCP
ncbi:hypothetical protein [Jeongeupia naejangsanensis]|uniref:Uncharacterized protein n=1 Tax=Jeongeupia naejangsanensis TaxID=613195 RepID=A0ABS2BIK4_9NEIS|nr:hypothetical protein [Jeongeupia naejangsanensis]MBM3115295.1 hypothetical protein [Jeongeupia naejangsanensis]